MNGNGQLKSKQKQQPQPSAPQGRGLFVPRQYSQNFDASERSLQVNIDSEDDAKSVIQNLPAIKAAYDQAGVTSVELCIADSAVKATENVLTGAINWCRTYIKHIAPQPGNVLFPLPAYRDLSLPANPALTDSAPESPIPVQTSQQPLVKPQRPVRADSARQ